ncbi:hypothetical protein L1049_027255 [Liquidambar formosana]|uniref:Uncharacterized protein n=1 Tax=Liquidambar formosana TaxID=63359 RepID=A0AAP0N527_LIQFO
MVLKVNQGEGVKGGKTESGSKPKMVVELQPAGEEVVEAKTEPWFKPKIGSVFPARRRLVKRMIFDYIVQSFASLFCSRGRPSSFDVPLSNKGSGPSGCLKIFPPPKTSNGKQNKKGVVPDP